MIKRLMPTLIEQGYVYIAESPLFEITTKDDESLFAYTDAEKDEIVARLGSKVESIQRSKGLGENTPQMMWETTMNPETRKLIKVMPDDDALKTDQTFDLFLGDDLAGRKEYIEENLWKYLDEPLD
jgi:DNA gyrase subunit B